MLILIFVNILLSSHQPLKASSLTDTVPKNISPSGRILNLNGPIKNFAYGPGAVAGDTYYNTEYQLTYEDFKALVYCIDTFDLNHSIDNHKVKVLLCQGGNIKVYNQLLTFLPQNGYDATETNVPNGPKPGIGFGKCADSSLAIAVGTIESKRIGLFIFDWGYN